MGPSGEDQLVSSTRNSCYITSRQVLPSLITDRIINHRILIIEGSVRQSSHHVHPVHHHPSHHPTSSLFPGSVLCGAVRGGCVGSVRGREWGMGVSNFRKIHQEITKLLHVQ